MNKNNYSTLASENDVKKTIKNLKNNGMSALFVQTSKDALKEILKFVPKGSEVMTATSVTLDQIGATTEFNSNKFKSVKNELAKLDRKTDHLAMQRLGAAPEYVIGSVHAITMDGKVIIASNTGSQLPAYAYGSSKVIWVVSTKKITNDLEDGLKRINEHVLPLESVRVQKAYGMLESEVKKLLIINKELDPERIKIIFVNEDLGF